VTIRAVESRRIVIGVSKSASGTAAYALIAAAESAAKSALICPDEVLVKKLL